MSLRCDGGVPWTQAGTSCAVGHRERGTYQSWLLRFQQAGAYELKLCYANSGTVLRGTPEESDAGQAMHLRFEQSGAEGMWTQEAYGYDAAGHQTSASGEGQRTIRYDSQGNADRIASATHTTEFLYGPAGRYLRKELNTTTRYRAGWSGSRAAVVAWRWSASAASAAS